MNESAVKATLYTWLSSQLGRQHVFTITFDADLITGNVVNGSFDAVAITAVPFDTDHDTTMANLAAEIQANVKIFTAVVTDDREITVTGSEFGNTITVVGPDVTAGASQAVATIDDVTEAVAITTIFENQKDDTGRNAPRPPYPYATVKIGTVIQEGTDELRDFDDDGIATFGGQRRATVSVNFFGPEAIEGATQAFNSLEKQTVKWIFERAGLAILQKNSVQNVPAMLETKFEERAVFDFFIGFADNVQDDIGVIEKVELSGEVEGAATGVIEIGPDTIDAT